MSSVKRKISKKRHSSKSRRKSKRRCSRGYSKRLRRCRKKSGRKSKSRSRSSKRCSRGYSKRLRRCRKKSGPKRGSKKSISEEIKEEVNTQLNNIMKYQYPTKALSAQLPTGQSGIVQKLPVQPQVDKPKSIVQKLVDRAVSPITQSFKIATTPVVEQRLQAMPRIGTALPVLPIEDRRAGVTPIGSLRIATPIPPPRDRTATPILLPRDRTATPIPPPRARTATPILLPRDRTATPILPPPRARTTSPIPSQSTSSIKLATPNPVDIIESGRKLSEGVVNQTLNNLAQATSNLMNPLQNQGNGRSSRAGSIIEPIDSGSIHLEEPPVRSQRGSARVGSATIPLDAIINPNNLVQVGSPVRSQRGSVRAGSAIALVDSESNSGSIHLEEPQESPVRSERGSIRVGNVVVPVDSESNSGSIHLEEPPESPVRSERGSATMNVLSPVKSKSPKQGSATMNVLSPVKSKSPKQGSATMNVLSPDEKPPSPPVVININLNDRQPKSCPAPQNNLHPSCNKIKENLKFQRLAQTPRI